MIAKITILALTTGLMIALAACGSDDRNAAQSNATETANIEVSPAPVTPTLPPLPTPPGKNLEPPYLNDNERLEAIGQYVPSFGGMYYDNERESLIVY